MELAHAVLKELIHYDPTSGVFTWRARKAHWFRSERARLSWNARFAGKSAGSLRRSANGQPYVRVTLLSRNHYAHRLAWFYMTGEWPEGEVDHEDRDATNNRWGNLRDLPHGENRKNSPFQRNNTSGVAGVTWDRSRRRWLAGVKVGGRRHNLGRFAPDDLDLAAMEVMEFRAEHGFHPSHGLQK